MNVFISSVVNGFEEYRAAARNAVTLVGYTPKMSEEFGARPYSSQTACMMEVDQADVVVLVLGAEFGFETSTGESVTQQEFRRAKSSNKRILAFLQSVPTSGKQEAFRREVSDYVDGLFRVTFANAGELSDGIVQGLSRLKQSSTAINESEFHQRLAARPSSNDSRWGGYTQDATLELAFLAQPTLSGAMRVSDKQRDDFFIQMSQAGLCQIRDGFKAFDQPDVLGLDTNGVKWRVQDDGLQWVSVALTVPGNRNDMFASYYVSPSRARSAALAAFHLMGQGRHGWFQLGLHGMDNKVFHEPPTSSVSSMSIPHRPERTLPERQLLIPASQGAFEHWLDDALFRFGRKLTLA
ncbi:hypothetical protein BV326_05444 [Pseudomonas syringae pv. actinidiae]|uniref:DUF4062 domain-containing protein n=1 Tax=Pseudomonas syringae TaxID=317 RepID=UPI000A221648|nr:DUF4062 domain-containing protein [Pseudomonas syringae]OSR65084.1 hypothetical protein BV326_05444 [Pseudomonas syringae pv. actinidiae]